jgi:hypothetical protein
LTDAVSDESIPQKIKNRTLLLAAGFNHGQDAFDKPAAEV